MADATASPARIRQQADPLPPSPLRLVGRRASDEATSVGSTAAALERTAARAAGRAAGVASLADRSPTLESAPSDPSTPGSEGVVAVPSCDGRFDLRVHVRAYLGDFLEMGWAVRHAIRCALADAELEGHLGLIDVQVIEIVLPIEAVGQAEATRVR